MRRKFASRVISVFGENRFGVKLQADDRPLTMSYRHDHPILRFSGDFQLRR